MVSVMFYVLILFASTCSVQSSPRTSTGNGELDITPIELSQLFSALMGQLFQKSPIHGTVPVRRPSWKVMKRFLGSGWSPGFGAMDEPRFGVGVEDDCKPGKKP
ncbi:hypothetical protein HDE_03735 [Halotydeus destructor]|nr:hypothetical protein HDE_03735 [Halotydeus destructor]